MSHSRSQRWLSRRFGSVDVVGASILQKTYSIWSSIGLGSMPLTTMYSCSICSWTSAWVASWPMKPRMSSASWGSFTNGRASLNVSTNQRSAAGSTTLSRLMTFEATGCPGIQCNPMSGTSKCTLRAWI